MNSSEDCQNCSKNELDEYLKKFKNYNCIDSEISTLEHKLQDIHKLNKEIEKYKFFNFKNVHVTLKFEIKPEILEHLIEDKYGIRIYIFGLFKETFKNFKDIHNIPLKIILYKIYLYRKTLETKFKDYFKYINDYRGEENIYDLEKYTYLRIEKLLEKQINLLGENQVKK